MSRLEGEPTSFSVVRKFDQMPRELGVRYNKLADTLRDPRVLPVTRIRTVGQIYGRITLASMTLINEAVKNGYSLEEIEQVINADLQPSSRKALLARIDSFGPLHPTRSRTERTLYTAVGATLVHPKISTDMAKVASALHTLGVRAIGDIPTSVVLAEGFDPPQSAEALERAMMTAQYALPIGTELPLRPVEFLPFIPRG